MNELPVEFKTIADGIQESKQNQITLPAIVKGQTPLSELKVSLRAFRDEQLARLQEAAQEKNKRAPNALTPHHCSTLLNKYIQFCLYDKKEGTKLAMYQPEEGIYTQNEDVIRRVISWLEPSLDQRKAGTVIYHLKNMAEFKSKTVSRFLIPVKNGIFNVKTKQLEPFSADYVFTAKIATPYVENPNLPDIEGWNVDRWLHDLASGEADTELLLWQVISASMNGNYSRKKSIWLFSDGNTGKGTYQQLIMNLVGIDNVATLKLPQFSEKFALPMLEEKVVCIGDDVPSNVNIDDSSNFNSVVTADYVPVEQKGKPKYTVQFNMTIIQSTNGLPKIHNKSEGTYKRFLIIEFKKQFLGDDDNWRIKGEYIKRQDVLEYVLHKAINIDFEQFINPVSSQQLLESYKVDNDPVQEFKQEVFDKFTSVRLPVSYVYACYEAFCEASGYKPLGSRKFISSLERILGKGWKKDRQRPAELFHEDFFPSGYTGINKYETAVCFINTRLEAV